LGHRFTPFPRLLVGCAARLPETRDSGLRGVARLLDATPLWPPPASAPVAAPQGAAGSPTRDTLDDARDNRGASVCPRLDATVTPGVPLTRHHAPPLGWGA